MAALDRETLLARAEALIPVLRERVPEAEALRRIPDESIADLIESGLMRATLPARLGGSEANYRTIMEIVALLSRGCASTGWVYCNLASCTFKLALWPEQAQDEIWDADRDALLTGNLIFPCGKATRVDGGYRLSGRWPFGSGIDHACANFFAAMVVDREPQEFRIFLVPKGEFTILDTWHASGLRGTGSNDAAVDDVFVPEYRAINAADTRHGAAPGNAVNTGTVYRLPLFAMFFTWVGAAVLGIAEGAVEGYVEATRTRAAHYSGQRLAELGTIHVKIAEAQRRRGDGAAHLSRQLRRGDGDRRRRRAAGCRGPRPLPGRGRLRRQALLPGGGHDHGGERRRRRLRPQSPLPRVSRHPRGLGPHHPDLGPQRGHLRPPLARPGDRQPAALARPAIRGA